MALLAVLVASLLINFGESRELRPTEHGLPFQNLPARSPEMTSFFGEENSLPEKKPPPPEILDTSGNATSSDTWWRGTPRKNNVRKALLIATVVCGGTGVVLLLAAAFLFAVNFYRQRSESLAATAGDDNSANQSTSVSALATAATVTDGKVTM